MSSSPFSPGQRVSVGVVPPSTLSARSRLFAALEEALEVRFVPAQAVGSPQCDGYVVAGVPPELTGASGAPSRTLSFAHDGAHGRSVGSVCLHDAPELDARLRGRRIAEHESPGREIDALEGLVLASDARSMPLWVRRASVDEVALTLPRLAPGETLRDLLVPGRFLALLALVEFVRGLVRSEWRPPPLRATFVIDDPNLHWRSYGAVDYARLARHAADVGYRVEMATIPLDAWFVYPPAARLFRERSEQLGLAIHGNDHRNRELWQPRSESDTAALLSQALRRIERLEARSGTRVSRVMVPPHGACSERTLRLLMRVGYDAITLVQPFPLGDRGEDPATFTRSEDQALAGWFPATVREDGFPILLRRKLFDLDEVVLRAYLDQPLIFYGHEGDLASGLEPLELLAREINSLPAVRWCSLAEIAATNAATRRPRAGVLGVRPFARRVWLEELDRVEELVLDWPHADGAVLQVTARGPGGQPGAVQHVADTGSLRLDSDLSGVEVALVPPDAIDHTVVPPPRPTITPIVRRFLTEGRDRTMPLARLRRGVRSRAAR